MRPSIRIAAALVSLASLSWLLPPPMCSAAKAPDPAPLADSAYAHQDWSAAERGYDAVVKREPANGRAWYRLGYASGALGHWARAIDAYRRADQAGVAPGLARYNRACAFARTGQIDSALVTLESLAATGYRRAAQIEGDEDLATLRADPRYAAILARVQRNAEPCADRAESRQFDFWIGDWNVTSNLNAGAQAGKSHVERILGQCVIFENWTGAFGTGKSFNAWNAELGCWQQNWMDDSGGVTNYSQGTLVGGAMRFLADKKDASGQWQKHRLTFFPLDPDRVRQLGEHSEDGGGTWKVDYDFDYRRVR